MSEKDQQREELEKFLLDREADAFAAALEMLTEREIANLHNMYVQMKEAKKMKTEISFFLKHDINVYHSADILAEPRCERAYMFTQLPDK